MSKSILVILTLIIAVLGYIAYAQSVKQLDKSTIINKIIVEKGKRRMHIYSNGKLIKTYKISIGKSPIGAKENEGDKKTPEGLYIINDKNPNSAYYKNLGISYPNEQDIIKSNKKGKKPGGQIKIHGIKNSFFWIGKLHLIIDWTDGCIAVSNDEMDELYDIVKIGTQIEIKP
jgi:murein L,D-transpeptidase YafK